MKCCQVCKEIKPLSDYWKDSSRDDGLCSSCKTCKNNQNEAYRKNNKDKHNARCAKWNKDNRDKVNAAQRAIRKAKPEKYKAAKERYKLKHPDRVKTQWRSTKLKSTFGITLSEYDKMLKKQGGVCKICNTTNPGKRKSFSVDHCHETGKIRGLLCSNCNLGLGNFKDSPIVMSAAIIYLSKEGAI